MTAAAQALAPEKYGRSIHFRFRRASQTTSAKAYDNSAFVKELKDLDSKKAKGSKLAQLQRECYSAYQPRAIYPDFVNAGKAYLKEFQAVKNDLSSSYKITAWKDKEENLDKITELVTGYVVDEENLRCPSGFTPNKCGVFKKQGRDFVLDEEIDCGKFTNDFALSVHGKLLWKTDPKNNRRCTSKEAVFNGFMKFKSKTNVPKGELCKKKARLSLSLKETSPLKRPKALFGILKTLLLDNDVKAVLNYAKIETMKPRQDAILLQVCYDPADDGVNKVKNLAKTLTTRLSAAAFASDLSDDGPYFQEKVDAFFVADYSHGSSWGEDICCLWAGLADTDQLILALKLYQSPIYGYEMAGPAYPHLMQTRAKLNKCKLHFNYKGLTLTGSSTKADFKEKASPPR